MALVEEVLEHLSVSNAFLILVLGFVLYQACKRIDETIRLRRLGVRGPRVPNKLPFGKPSYHCQ